MGHCKKQAPARELAGLQREGKSPFDLFGGMKPKILHSDCKKPVTTDNAGIQNVKLMGLCRERAPRGKYQDKRKDGNQLAISVVDKMVPVA